MTDQLAARAVLAATFLVACSAAGYTARLQWPPFPAATDGAATEAPPPAPAVVPKPSASPRAPADAPSAAPAGATSTVPGATSEDSAGATSAVPGATNEDSAAATSTVPGATNEDSAAATSGVPVAPSADPAGATSAVPVAPTGGNAATPDADGLFVVADPAGRYGLRHGDSWRVVPPAPDTRDVDWVLRLERGRPDVALPSGAKLPPDGARLELGIARVAEGTDLTAWVQRALPLEGDRYSVTMDGMDGTIGADRLPTIFREGQVLPFFGRWREWLVPSPGLPDTVYVVRARAFGAKNQLEMTHAKVVASTLRLR